jgi:pimeloyl-ACP methyl ester carboxylesterase
MPFLPRDGGVRIHYERHGDRSERPPLLLSHGFSASASMWDGNVGALCEEREVLTWDMRGHARSDRPPDPARYGVDQSVEDMSALLGLLDVQRAVLCGMSLGGYLSLAFHASHPQRVAALVLVDTGPGFRSEESRRRWNAVAERTATELERDGLAALPAHPEVGTHPDALGLVHTARRVMAQHDAQVIESLQRISVPTLVVVGALDANFLAAADYMAGKIPLAGKIVLDGAGHAANIEAVDLFNVAVRDFLEEI